MPARRDLTLFENNEEKVNITITDDDTGAAQNLTGCPIVAYIKPTAQTADNALTVTQLSTASGDITVTNAVGGVARIVFPASVLVAGKWWWRVDVTISGVVKTACYGPLRIIDT